MALYGSKYSPISARGKGHIDPSRVSTYMYQGFLLHSQISKLHVAGVLSNVGSSFSLGPQF